jgi:hypothetical protein
MTENELKALLAHEERAALGFLGGELAEDREKAMNYYMGELFGNEVDGRSKVVSSDVADTVEWILPSLMKMFTAGDDVVSFEPQGQEDEEAAKQATEYNNFIFMRENNGFRVLYCMFKDALLQKTGCCKVYPEFSENEELDEFLSVPDDQFAVASYEKQNDQKGAWYLKEHTEEQQFDPVMGPVTLHTGVWCRTVKRMKVCVEPMPPEETLISRKAKGDIDEPSYMAHRSQKTASELIEMGYPKKKVDLLSGEGPSHNTDAERIARFKGIDEDPSGEYSTVNHAMRLIWVTEAYVRVDYDGDGVAEMRRIVHAGSGTTILENEVWEGPRPFAIISPILIPHRLIGLSIADQTMEFQLLKSTLWRQILDNLYLTNNPQKYIDPGAVNIDDILQPRVGSIIRPPEGGIFRPDGIQSITVEPVAAASFPMLEYIDAVRENRTGVTRYNQGTDADTLNKTATGVSAIMSASQQRIELIARVFAEGIKRIFELQNWYIRRYPELAKRAIRLRNKEWVEMDPGQWGGDFDLQINVGLGTNNKDQMLQHLSMLALAQKEIIALQQGVSGPLVTADNVFNLVSKMVENTGFKTVEDFFTDPKNAQPQEPKPDPRVEAEKAKMELKAKESEQKMALEQQKAQLEQQKAAHELQMREREAQLEMQIQWMLAQVKAQTEQMLANIKLQIEEIKANAQVQQTQQKLAMDAEVHDHQMARAAETAEFERKQAEQNAQRDE